MTKSALSEVSGVSRSLLDGYLKGTTQPSLPQLERLAAAAGRRIEVTVKRRLEISESFIAVLELGELFPRKEKDPLPDLSDVWALASRRAAAHA